LEASKNDRDARKQLEQIMVKNREKGVDLVNRCKEMILKMGIPEDRLTVVTAPRSLGLAKDILEKGLKNQYDAIVAGRRGLSGVQQFFMGSLTAKLVEHAIMPVWIIDGERFNSKIMVAVDGSETALKAVDHTLFMVSSHPDARITLYHVKPMFRDYCEIELNPTDPSADAFIESANRRCIANFYGRVLDKLKEYQVDEERIEYLEADRKLSIGKTIVSAAKNLGFATLVLGRRGIGNSFFMGSVSNYVLRNSSQMAIWIVP
ncbi:MAG: universal stress protein, partial [Thermodesulfobacteriota bacterium]